MKIISLTATEASAVETHFVNAEMITHFSRDMNFTTVHVSGGNILAVQVTDSPEEILEKISNA